MRDLKPELKDLGQGFKELGDGIGSINIRRLGRLTDKLDAYGMGIQSISTAIADLAAIDIGADFVNKMNTAAEGLSRVASVKGLEDRAGGFLSRVVKGVQGLFSGGIEASVTPVVAGAPEFGDLEGAGRVEVELTRMMQVKMDGVIVAIREEFESTRDAEERWHQDSMAAAAEQFSELRKMRRRST
jgi:hypothetical protein